LSALLIYQYSTVKKEKEENVSGTASRKNRALRPTHRNHENGEGRELEPLRATRPCKGGTKQRVEVKKKEEDRKLTCGGP